MARPFVPAGLAELVRACEGFRPRPYLCPAGHWTIGYGELCQRDSPPVTRQEAEARLQAALQVYVAHALRLSPGLAWADPGRLAAVSDFVYNLGSTRYAGSTFRRLVNAQDWAGAAEACERWVYGGGRRLPGLVARRAVERKLLLGC